MLIAAVDSDLSNVASFAEKSPEKTHFTVALRHELGMKSQSRPDPLLSLGEQCRPRKSFGRVRHGEYICAGTIDLVRGALRRRKQVYMAMEVDQIAKP